MVGVVWVQAQKQLQAVDHVCGMTNAVSCQTQRKSNLSRHTNFTALGSAQGMKGVKAWQRLVSKSRLTLSSSFLVTQVDSWALTSTFELSIFRK